MSSNLVITANGKNIKVWQTPTEITYLCLMTKDGIKSRVTGDDAKRALLCYITWVSQTLGGFKQTPLTMNDELDYARDTTKKHVESLNKYLEKRLVAYSV